VPTPRRVSASPSSGARENTIPATWPARSIRLRVAVAASIGVFTAYIDAGTDSSTCGRLRAVTMIAVITGSTASAVSTSTAATRPGAKAEHESTISDRAVHTWPDPRSGSRCAPCMANSPG